MFHSALRVSFLNVELLDQKVQVNFLTVSQKPFNDDNELKYEDSVIFVWIPIATCVFRCYVLYQFKLYQLRPEILARREIDDESHGACCWSLLMQPVQPSSE